MSDRKPYHHRFPLSVIGYALRLYHRFPLRQRDVQELLRERGIQVSHETLRQWSIKFAPLLIRPPAKVVFRPSHLSAFACLRGGIRSQVQKQRDFRRRSLEELRHCEPRRGSQWFLDEVYVEIGGKKHWLWRAVDDDGAVLDILLQEYRDTRAARSFFIRLIGEYDVPEAIHTDKLWSYGTAIRALPVLYAVEHA